MPNAAEQADDPLARTLAATLAPGAVLVAREDLAFCETDWTGRFHGRARLAVRPRDAAETAAVLRQCSAALAAVVPQGGNTGLVGGGVPRGGEVVLTTSRLTGIVRGPENDEVIAGAGTTLQALQEHALQHGMGFGVDIAARGSATLGGMAATNAGGVRVVRYGDMRAQLRGLEAVLPDGTVIDHLHGPVKDNAGYDLARFIAGSEGTLAVITRLRLRLVPLLERRAVVLVGLDSTSAALSMLARLRRAVPDLDAAEIFYEEGLDLVCAHAALPRPFAAHRPVYLLVESAGREDPLPALANAIDAGEDGLDSAVGMDRATRDALWAYRERHTEAINAVGVPQKLDVALPLAALAQFEAQLRPLVATFPAARLVLFGHLAEGNLHINLLGLDPSDEALADAVLRLVIAHGGSISSEHGIGVAKVRWLAQARGAAETALMRRLKAAFDPAGIMNPGVLFPE